LCYGIFRKGRVFCQNVLEFIEAKSGEKNCPARKSRKREDSDDFIKEIALLQMPRRSSKRRQSQPILDSIHRYPSKVVAQGDTEKEPQKVWLKNYL
jgi:hypothetical protein